ncbi:DUF423 domain-containing protein [Crateriforma spongiae]|uniref:DUF423 domain-containing protein n=1 Tax=Crateriforma spongiae TaxID=2724528 RepID=UPI0028F40393|nr:DUF423 domain-containing protein [Crateriforma spongiae]
MACLPTDAQSHCWLGWAGVCGALAVLIGAFGAHGLPDHLSAMGLDQLLIQRRLDQFDVGARYHLAHAIALLALSTLPTSRRQVRTVRWTYRLMWTGVLLFSGSLYVLVLTNTPWLGAITPLGGLAWIAAWTLLAIAGFFPVRNGDEHHRETQTIAPEPDSAENRSGASR